jgi:hypothetical protein
MMFRVALLLKNKLEIMWKGANLDSFQVLSEFASRDCMKQ